MKRAVSTILIICCFTSLGISQTISVGPQGISPRDVELGRVDASFNRVYNGLLNVGIGTQMYFRGTFEDSSLTGATWSLMTKPGGSTATLGSPVEIDSATEIITFTPDVIGTYAISFVEGSYGDTVTFNAGTYVGMGASAADGGCAQCHAPFAEDWEATGHATALTRGLSGQKGDHFASYCVSCHSTGHDTDADNDGFDDRTQFVSYLGVDTNYVFPDSAALTDHYGSPDSSGHLFPAVWDSSLVFFPNSMKLANIQCESCHGPGSEHKGNTADHRIALPTGVETCAACHNAGTHHVFPEQWYVTGHASPPEYPTGPGRASCARCHTPGGFIQHAEGDVVTDNAWGPFDCATCHDPHAHDNEHQLRTVEATLANGEPVMAGGSGKLCMNCHQSRRDADPYTDEPHGHYGPHYMTQADMLSATNVVTFGKQLPSSPHLTATEDGCVTCHMSEEAGHVDEAGNVNLVGEHSLNMVFETGTDTIFNVAACAPCHGDVGETFAEKRYFDGRGNADHDGDGTEEGLQEEVHGLMDQLAAMLPAADGHDAYDPHDDVDDTWTLAELKAAFNYEMVYYDRSYGIHNPAFTVALLKVSIQALENDAIDGQIVAIDDLPQDQGNMVRIIWEKFADDGVSPTPIRKYLVQRLDDYTTDTTWTTVGEVTAHGAPRYALDVPTLYNTIATEFQIVALRDGAEPMVSLTGAGTSVDNLVPHAPANVIALFDGGVNLSWEAPADPDVNFYRIYRATSPNFVASEANQIGTTIELSYVDAVSNPGDYYYKIAAEDFNGNLGEISAEVDAHITGLDEAGLPTEYALAQNYPNPFNPSTTIKFQLKEAGPVALLIYDHLGREVLKLVDQPMSAGYHSVTVGADRLASGVYFYRIRVNEFTATRKMLLLK
ncbi:MAG: T9SS type A sorting domain-containing protein [Fidelibacterota bacterium]|nr:MAG: T9SS type A sorting domain-containing protein [Candidatus Neomarinimicrobiota bacterium]